jgi:hypothetical protein
MSQKQFTSMTSKSQYFDLEAVALPHNVPFDAALWIVIHLFLMGAFAFEVAFFP